MKTAGAGVEKVIFIFLNLTNYLSVGTNSDATYAVVGHVTAIAGLSFKSLELVAIETA